MQFMLTQIKLTNFKCFKEETTIPLSKFNLFTGTNGDGKSTALQSLLLMRQSIEHDDFTSQLILNGSCVNLGSFDDVRNREISRENPIFFEFSYTHKQDSFSMRLHLEPKFDVMSLSILKVDMCLQYQFEVDNKLKTETVCNTVNYDEETGLFYRLGEDVYQYGYSFRLNAPSLSNMIWTAEEHTSLSNFLGFNFGVKNLHFISADRIGPQEFYFKSILPEFPHVGTKGEFTVNLLDKLAEELVNETLCLGDDARTLVTQTQMWLGKILKPLTLKVNPLRVNILELLIGDFKPANVGFGYSSILPIIVSGLIAKPGEKIIIENPEIHLHPKAQSAIIEFLVKVANTGVQIFIESHSDHVLNALRLATKSELLKSEDVSILFFTQESGNSKVINPTIDHNGRIDQWPEYFFDETAKSLASLAARQQPRIKAPKA